MDNKVILEAVRNCTEKVFGNMVHMNVITEAYAEKIRIHEEHLTAMVGFTGTYVGLASIHCTDVLARRIGGSMLGMRPEILSDEDVRDALGEIANMIAGNLKARFAEIMPGQNAFEQSVPSVISGTDYETFAVNDAKNYCIAAKSDNHIFYVELALKNA